VGLREPHRRVGSPGRRGRPLAVPPRLSPEVRQYAVITGNYWAEGPTVTKIGEEWVVFFDKYRDHKYGAIVSKDLINWTDVSNKISLPGGIRHGTIFKISRDELALLLK